MTIALHSLLIYKICFNERGKPENTVYVDDIDGQSLNSIFERFCNKNKDKFITTKTGGKHICLHDYMQNRDGTLVYLRSGKSGVPFDVIDIKSADTIESYDESAASMVPFRSYLSTIHGRGYAFMCIEHVPNAAGDTVLFQPFASFLRETVPEVVMKTPEPVALPETLEQFVSAESIEIKKYIEQSDIADSFVSEGDIVTCQIRHKKGRPFPASIFDVLKRHPNKAISLFGMSGTIFNPERDGIFVSLKDRNGNTRKYEISDSLNMKFKEVLNPDGSNPPSDDVFIALCKERCLEIEGRIGKTIG